MSRGIVRRFFDSDELREFRGSVPCLGLSSLFFPDDERSVEAAIAKSMCHGVGAFSDAGPCPVREKCLQVALDNVEPHGVWGGMTSRERRQEIRRRRNPYVQAKEAQAPAQGKEGRQRRNSASA